ncbi:hypothetical protein VZT92_016531 [Zoarces viviparus]|uniref:Uncharacterized protein n=1 Tax=Zoarces viviparus TaxID=48416 RepID=A0AAW1EUF2_ZOAVI
MVVQRWVEVGPGRSLDDWRREGKHGSLDAVRSTPSICAAMKYNTPAVLLYSRGRHSAGNLPPISPLLLFLFLLLLHLLSVPSDRPDHQCRSLS